MQSCISQTKIHQLLICKVNIRILGSPRIIMCYSHYGKHGMLRIVRNLSHKSMSLLPEVLDGRKCVLWLRYLSDSDRCNTKMKQRDTRRIDSPSAQSRRVGAEVLVTAKSEAQREYYQARFCLRKAHRNGSKNPLFNVFKGVKLVATRS